MILRIEIDTDGDAFAGEGLHTETATLLHAIAERCASWTWLPGDAAPWRIQDSNGNTCGFVTLSKRSGDAALHACAAIADTMDGVAWNADTLDDVARFVRGAGFDIGDVDGNTGNVCAHCGDAFARDARQDRATEHVVGSRRVFVHVRCKAAIELDGDAFAGGDA